MRTWCQGLLALLLLAAFLGSCATIPEQRPDNESLRIVAENYWRLRMADDYERTYVLEGREDLPPFKDYLDKVRAMKKFTIVSYSIGKVSVDGTAGTVEVELNIMLPAQPKPIKQIVYDRWTYKEGKWLHLLPK